MKIEPYCLQQKDSPGLQISAMYKTAIYVKFLVQYGKNNIRYGQGYY